MKLQNRFLYGALAGTLLIAALIGLNYLAFAVLGVAFIPYDLFGLISRLLPGDVLTFGIDMMVDTIIALDLGAVDRAAKLAENWMAVFALVGLGLVVGAVFFATLRDLDAQRDEAFSRWMPGLGLGVLLGLAFIQVSMEYDVNSTASTAASALWILGSFVAWGVALVWVYNTLIPKPVAATPAPSVQPENAPIPTTQSAAMAASVHPINRRQFMVQVGGATATITLLGAGLGELLAEDTVIEGGDVDLTEFRDEAAETLVTAAPGTRPEYTPLENHYRIDINNGEGPAIDEAEWRLEVSGLVENSLSLTLEQIRTNYTPLEQIITMSCISNRVGGRLISNILWTGASLRDILNEAMIQPEARFLRITSADGFDEYLDIELAMNDPEIVLAYHWDNVPLPRRHGFPVRVHIPNRYGMKQPKWITTIEAVEDWEEGYWVRRGWSREAIVRATSVVDTVAVDGIVEANGARLVPIGGIAWAGTRGISRVEVRVDDGEWQPARLRTPLSAKAWTIWRYDWPFEEGEHTFYVRTYEGDGTMQIEEVAGVRPDGATGIHSREASL